MTKSPVKVTQGRNGERGDVTRASLPALRADLTISRQQSAAGTVLVVKDPRSGRFFLFREAERLVAEHLDGETPLEVVRRRAEDHFGASLPAETLQAFIESLRKNGLLRGDEDSIRRRSDRFRRIRGSPLYLRIALFDPDQLLTRAERQLRFVFTRGFLFVSAAIILIAIGITISRASELSGDVSRLYQHASIALVLALIVVTAAVHEFGHGVTCKHFGGEVRETGFLLIYFLPAFYVNVSDAWLFREKSKRLWVGLAGPYAELCFWALVTFAWRVTETDTWINHLSLIVMTISGLKILLNANPFLKLDGYYLLSDALEMPNLRKRAFRHVGNLTKRAFGFSTETAEESSDRDRRVYLAYGSLAMIGSLLVLGYAALIAGELIRSGQQLAIVLLAGVVTMSSRRRLGRLFGTSSGAADPEGDASESGSVRHRSTRSKASTKRGSRRRRPWYWAVGAGATIPLLFFVRLDLRIAGPFVVLPQTNADVRAGVAGLVVEVLVDEGDSVRAGAVIARLSDRDLRADRSKTEAELRAATANLSRLKAGSTAEEISVARATVRRAEREVEYHRARLARYRSMIDAKVISSQEFEDAQAQATSAENNLAEVTGRLNVLLRGTRREELDASEAQIDRLKTQQSHVEERLGLLEIVSPVSGTVATPSLELRAMRGRLVGEGTLIARVFDVSVVTAQIIIPEKEIADVRVGRWVALRTRAHPDVTFEGRVTTIATSAEGTAGADAPASVVPAQPGDARGAGESFVVTTLIDNRRGLLKPGMSGLAKVSAGERRIIELITRRLARTLKVEFWSWW